jgi:hypothetical protein
MKKAISSLSPTRKFPRNPAIPLARTGVFFFRNTPYFSTIDRCTPD